MEISYTSYMIMKDTFLAEQSFFLVSPEYLSYMVPACPNFTPEDCTSGDGDVGSGVAHGGLCGDGGSATTCPKRSLHEGQWKFSLLATLSGTNVNSLRIGDDDAPRTTPLPEDGSCKQQSSTVNDIDIAQYRTLIFRTMLDLGAMGVEPRAWLSRTDSTGTLVETNLTDVPPGENVADADIHFYSPTNGRIRYNFVKYISTGLWSRQNFFSARVCNETYHGEPNSDGNYFTACGADVTGFEPPPDSIPTCDQYPPDEPCHGIKGEYGPDGGTIYKKLGKRGDPDDVVRRLGGAPAFDVSEVQVANVTIRPASCSGRPPTPDPDPSHNPWPEAPSDCPWWYLEASYDHPCTEMPAWAPWWHGHNGDETPEWTGFAPPCWKYTLMDNYTRCESGSCFFIDLNVDLGGETLESRTVFGNPPNDAEHGILQGTFFIYDPAVDIEENSLPGDGGGAGGDGDGDQGDSGDGDQGESGDGHGEGDDDDRDTPTEPGSRHDRDTPTEPGSHGEDNTGMIVGIVLGSIALVLVLVAAFVVWQRHKALEPTESAPLLSSAQEEKRVSDASIGYSTQQG